MVKKHSVLLTVLLILPLSVMIAGCGDYGKVDQGRVVDYDKANKMVTIIRDKSLDPKKPDYSHLPPVKYKLPDAAGEMGPEPRVGKRMKLDVEKNQIIIFIPTLNNFVTIDYKPLERKDNVSDKDPLVFDIVSGKAKQFPIVDIQKKTISLYSKRQKIYVTFMVPEQYFILPPDTWDTGDEVRIYFKEEGKAARFMNVSKTDIFKK